MLKFSKKGDWAHGNGAYENDEKFDINISLRPKDTHHWIGVFDTEDGLVDFALESLQIDKTSQSISSSWHFEGVNYSLEGTLGKRLAGRTRDYRF